MFQFHEGPIKTFMTANGYEKVKMFQFHEGPIKTFFDAIVE